MSYRETDPVSKLAKLNSSDDYILWKRRVFAYIRKYDAELVGFQTEPSSNAVSVRKKWFELVMKAKSTIILCLGDSPLSKVRLMVDDDDKTAKELWDELEKIYTSSNAQSILNLRQELDTLRFEEGKSWDAHVNKFMDLLSKLATYDEELSEKEKASKLLRSLPESFGGFAMIAQLQDLELERLIQAMQAEISRRLNSSGSSSRVDDISKAARASKGKQGKKGSHFSDRINKKGSDECYVCGKKNHFARDCWYKASGSNNRGRSRGGYRGYRGGYRGGRGRGRGRGGGRGGRGGRSDFSSSQPFSHGYGNGINGAQPSWTNGGGNSGQQVMPSGTSFPTQGQAPQANYQQFGNPGNHQVPDSNYPFQGFMAKLKRSKLASINAVKTDDALIDSGATHFFFHSVKYFKNYRRIKDEDVQSASGVSRIVGMGTVFIPIGGGVHFEAYHAPEFGENILSVSKLSKFFTLQFSTDGYGDFSICHISSMSTGKLVFRTPETDGLYKMSVPKIHKSSRPAQRSFSANIRNSVHLNCIACASSAALFNTNYRRTPVLHDNKPLQWHFRTGHPSPTRYSQLSQVFPDVPFFPRSTLNEMFCVPCQQGKTKRAAVLPTQTKVTMPLELVHLDISGPVLPSLSGSVYALSIMDSMTSKSNVFFLKKKSDLATCLMKYKASSELHTGCSMRKIRLDGAGENMSGAVETFCTQHGIRLDPSPPYAHQSNGTAERLIQELWARTRVLLFASQLPASLWAEAMNHSNWLRNRLPSSRIQDRIPILLWDPSTTVQFSQVPVFGQPGFAFKYRSETVPNKKFLARSVHGHFVGMGSDKTIIRVYVPESKSVMLTRIQDFRQYSEEKLPGVASIIDGIARQSELEGTHSSDGHAEDALMKAFQVFSIPTNPSRILRSRSDAQGLLRSFKADSRLPSSFRDSILDPNWRVAIDREYKSLRAHNTWEYVKRTPDMKPVPFTWVFRLKPLDNDGKAFLHKARCVIRGDKQTAYVDFDPNNVYAPVACHESIRILFAYAAAYDLQMEGADISNAYLYGKIDIPIIMNQPTNSTGIPERPGMVCRLLRSLYGLRQAGEIWGSLFCQTLLSWGFNVSKIDKRMFFLQVRSEFIILVVVVDDMKFVSNSTALMTNVKQRLSATFDVKLFGTLRTFIGWEVRYFPNGIKVTQTRYAKDLLSRCGMENCNAVWSPLPTTADVTSSHDGDMPLSSAAHSEYRSLIGALIHLAVSTRPDLSFAVCTLARHVHNPTDRHQTLLKRVLRYIAGTTEHGLQYNRKPIKETSLSAHVDADWGGCMETRHSTTGYILTVNGGPVSWKSQKQTVIALSSAESEYVAMSSCAKQVTWLRRIMWEVEAKRPFDVNDTLRMAPTPVYSDSTAAIALTKNDTVAARNKHIDIKVHHLKDLWKRRVIEVLYVPSKKNIADLLTKPVSFRTLRDLTELLSM